MILTMGILGDFRFSATTAAFQSLQRQSAYRWQSVDRVGRKPAQQFLGAGADKITLQGVIFPHYRGGLSQVSRMREMAGRGKPLPLTYTLDRVGQYCGLWCIAEISEGRTVFFSNGAPRKIEFSLALIEYGEDLA